jgi:hypothetical protein
LDEFQQEGWHGLAIHSRKNPRKRLPGFIVACGGEIPDHRLPNFDWSI